MRTYFRLLTRQRLSGRFTRFEVTLSLLVTAMGLLFVAVAFTKIGLDLVYALDGRAAAARVVSTRFPFRDARRIEVHFRFEAPDGRRLDGTEITLSDRALVKEPLAVEYLPQDPTINRIYDPHRYPAALLSEGLLISMGAALFAISGVPLLCDRWRTSLDTKLRETGVPADGVVIWMAPSLINSGFTVARYEYQDKTGGRHTAEMYDIASKLRHLRVGQRGRVMFDPAHPSLSMWVVSHA